MNTTVAGTYYILILSCNFLLPYKENTWLLSTFMPYLHETEQPVYHIRELQSSVEQCLKI